jgi:hypothetical protein
MLSQRHMGAPLYRYTSQADPRFGDSWSLEEWKWCHYVMVEAYIHLRPLHTSIFDIYKGFEQLLCCLKGIWVHPYRYTSQVGPRFGKSGSLEELKWYHNIMDEADVPLKLLHASILDIYKVIEPLVCCLKGIWVPPYTITPARLAPDLGSQGHLWSDNDVITSWLRLISTSDPFMHPYYAYTKCLSYWYAVSRAYGCTLIPLHRPSWPQIWGFRFTWGVKMMP